MAKVDGREVAVFREDGGFYALDNTCLHMGGSIADGRVKRVSAAGNAEPEGPAEEVHIQCPLHGWEYDIKTGGFTGDRKRKLRCYDVTTRGEDLYIQT